MSVKVRFAPSPTGKLHVGNIRAALMNWLFARQQGGVFMLRSDDTDQVRSTQAFEDGIQHDLAWLGLTHDEFARQSERFARYDEFTAWLKENELLYPCYETAEELDRKRKLQRARSMPPVYDRAALNMTADDVAAFEAEGRKPHWRFKLSGEAVVWNDLIRDQVSVDTSNVSDPVLIRADGQYLYTLPSCVDDIDFGITHVIRGEDHVTNTATQIELFKKIIDFKGAGNLPIFAHHSLLVGADGAGLSKRFGSLSIEGMRDAGLEAEAITSLLARLGTSDAIIPCADIMAHVENFDFAKMSRAPARFDEGELKLLNAKILHDMPFEKVADRLTAMDIDAPIWDVAKGNIEKIEDATYWRDVIKGDITPVIEDAAFTNAAAALIDGEFGADSWKELTTALKEQTGRKGKQLFMPLRLALTGRPHGPDMGTILPMIGAEKAKARLSQ